MAGWPVDLGYGPQRPGGPRPRVDRNARSSASRRLRSPRRIPLPQPAPETTSFADASGPADSDVPAGTNPPRPCRHRSGPADPAALPTAEANEPRGAMTVTGHI